MANEQSWKLARAYCPWSMCGRFHSLALMPYRMHRHVAMTNDSSGQRTFLQGGRQRRGGLTRAFQVQPMRA